MLKKITKVGNSQGLVFDSALRELSGLQAGDEVNVTVHEGGTIVLTPIRKAPSAAEVTEVIRKTVKNYRKTLKRLA
jgi:antitoxin component of MazEF toxin-antitoxin module